MSTTFPNESYHLFIPCHVTWNEVFGWCLLSLAVGQGRLEVCEFVEFRLGQLVELYRDAPHGNLGASRQGIPILEGQVMADMKVGLLKM